MQISSKPFRIGHHAYGARENGMMVRHPGMAGEVTADFPSMRWNPETRDFDYGGSYPEDGGLAAAIGWAHQVLGSDPSVDHVVIMQSVQEYEGCIWRRGRHVQTITREA